MTLSPHVRTAGFILASMLGGSLLVFDFTRLVSLLDAVCHMCDPAVALPAGTMAGLIFAVMQLSDRRAQRTRAP